MGVQGKRPQRGLSEQFSEPTLITNVDEILKSAVDNSFVDEHGNVELEKVAEDRGIEIKYEDLPSNESGYLVCFNGRFVIGVNRKHNKKRQRFTIAHELGHYFLHKDSNLEFRDQVFYRIENTSSIEYAANEFASRLLIPSDRLATKIQEGMVDIKKLADFFAVSQDAMKYRIISLGYSIESHE